MTTQTTQTIRACLPPFLDYRPATYGPLQLRIVPVYSATFIKFLAYGNPSWTFFWKGTLLLTNHPSFLGQLGTLHYISLLRENAITFRSEGVQPSSMPWNRSRRLHQHSSLSSHVKLPETRLLFFRYSERQSQQTARTTKCLACVLEEHEKLDKRTECINLLSSCRLLPPSENPRAITQTWAGR